MWSTYALVALSSLSAGWLLGRRRRFLCRICFQELPPVHQDGRCGGTPGVEDAAAALASIQRRLAHGIYTTATGGGDGTAAIVCTCGWVVEMATLAEAREEHRVHVAGEVE